MQIFSNNGATTLAVAVTALDTTITVVDASKFPVGEFKVTLETVDRSKNEIVLVTGVAGNVLTVVRAQEGTVATDFPVDAKVENRVTAEWLNVLQTTVDGMVDDTEVATTKAYSSSKVLDLHNAQAEAIAHLSGASATFSGNVSQVVPEAPAAKVDISWVNGQASSNASIFTLGTNEVNFYVDGNYSFLTTITLYRLSDGSNTTVTFELYDADGGTVLKSISQPVDMTAGTKETLPLNVLVPITGATEANPVRIKVRMGMTAANGTLELFAFSSVVTAQALVSAGGKTYTSTEFTATAGQTAFNLAYTPGYVEVYHNGLKLSAADFTASNGTSVVLGTAAIAGDAVEVVAYGTFNVADSYTKAEVDSIVDNIDALPSQVGNNGKVLSTDGTIASWTTVINDTATDSTQTWSSSKVSTELGGKQATITGAATTVTSSSLTGSMAMVTDASGKIAAHSTVSATELGYLDGVTSAIQTQLNGKAATNHNHNADNITTGTLPVTRGGTGATTLTGLIKGNGTSAFTSVTAPTSGIVGTADTQTLTNKTIQGGIFTSGYTEGVFAVSGTTPALSPTNGSIQTWVLGTTQATPTFGTFNSGQSMTLMIDDGAGQTVTWPAITWKTNGGVAPILNTTGYTVIVLWKVGSVVYGARVGDA